MFRFLHTSDLHLGKRFGNMPDELRGRLMEARHEIINRLAEAAESGGAHTILVAGDVFDTETPSPAIVRQALQAMDSRPDIRWFLIPGNHDSVQAEELWRRAGNDCPENVSLLFKPEPIDLSADAVLLPAPCPVRRPGRDLTEWMMGAEIPEEKVRIGLAHGAVREFGEDGATEIIAPDRASLAGLDYMALGDWHGQIRVNDRTWYSGTPEPDRFKHNTPGQALLIDIPGRGSVPEVTRVETGRFLWKQLVLDLVSDDDPIALLEREVVDSGNRRDVLLDVTVRGRLDLAGRAKLAAAAGGLEADFAWMNYDDSELALEYDGADLDAIDQAGALRRAADALADEASRDETTPEDAGIAERALHRLYGYCMEVDS